jgi:hypothetical protein
MPRELAPGHLVACHFPLTEAAPAAANGAAQGAAQGTAPTGTTQPTTSKAVS